ncbi:lasso peptide biosynthesis B2 protein [Anabaena minutissima FACHB-250]|nr:lasso peptide biosynthesis B2 protein [Anabaena minutissima FACHB-250]
MDDQVSLTTININLSCKDRLIGLLTVIVAYIAVRCLSLFRICKILRPMKGHCSREITTHEADIAWAAVRKSNLFLLGRVACLELSLAFMLFALTKGLSSTWCVGVATEPIGAHSWVEVAGKPFREVNNFEHRFRKLLTV